MASFINRIVNKTKELFERLISKARVIIDSISSWVKRVKKHKEYIRDVEESNAIYVPEFVDTKLSEELKNSLDKLAPGGLVAYMQKMTADERMLFIEKNLLPLISSKMNVTYDKLEWFEDDRLCGFYNHDNKMVALNIAYLAQDNEILLTVLLNTIIHECKHARQWAAVEGVNFGYSQQQVDEWKRNFEDYISPRESDEGYFKQPVELDARGFASSIIDDNVIFEN